MIPWIITFILFSVLIAVLVLQFKQLSALKSRYESVVHELKSRRSPSDEALEELEKWKKRYEAEKAAKEEQIKEAERWKKRYWEQVHEDSDSYRTQVGKEDESWGDREQY
jgi:predicted Holliday junction resolvase-like endonuclease